MDIRLMLLSRPCSMIAVLFKINDTVTNFIFLSDDQNNRIGVKSMKRKKFL